MDLKNNNKKQKHQLVLKVFFVFILTVFISLMLSCSFLLFDEKNTASTVAKTDGSNLNSQTENGSSIGENFSEETNSGTNQEYWQPVKVMEVVDGDTIKLENGEKVRLIGINTEEDGMHYYGEAKEFLSILVLGRMVRLENDSTDRDMYGRLLRYIFLIDGNDEIFVNEAMVRYGFANSYIKYPDIKYSSDFIEAENLAREKGAGLWEKSEYHDFLSLDLQYNPDGKDEEKMNEEFLLIINNSNKDMDISSWTVKDSGTNIYKFKKASIDQKDTMTLHTGNGRDTKNDLYWNATRPVWNNDHDRVYLRDTDGLLANFISY